MNTPAPQRFLFVCLGNICRSPMAEGIFRAEALAAGLREETDFICDSCGTGSWHVGEAPDVRAQAALAEQGIDISGLTARQLRRADLSDFDWLLAMDRQNLAHIERMGRELPGGPQVSLFLDFSDMDHNGEVPDPYYGGEEGFLHCERLIRSASRGLIAHAFDRTLS